MKKHIKVYLVYFGYGEQDIIMCERCGAVASDIHHILYKSQGGKDIIGNLIALCRDCHDKAHFKKEPYINKQNLLQIVERRCK